MVSSFIMVAFCSLLFISATFAKTSQVIKTNALLLQVTKDPKTLQYLTQISQRTPLVSLSFAVDLGGRYLWTDCDSNGYISSTYKFYDCFTPQCRDVMDNTFCDSCASPVNPGCHSSSCVHFAFNPFGPPRVTAELAADVVLIQSTNGKNPTKVVSVPEFFFFCADNKLGLLEGLADGVTGIAGFGRTTISLSSQFARFFDYRKIFALCLSPSSRGVIFIGDGPYQFLPNVNAASNLTCTPLIINRGRFLEQPSADYFIGVKSIKVNGQVVPINTTLLSFDKDGVGGTTISTSDPYTIIQPEIYEPFVNAFVKATANFTRVAPVAPFEVCYNSKNIGSTRVGPAVPVIELVLQSEDVYWRINGANSMVQVSKNVLCLGFVKPKDTRYATITIGGYQLENNLVQFNVAKSIFGFSSSLLSQKTTCANFNFTSTA